MYTRTNRNEKTIVLAEAMANETRQETVLEYEDEINKLKEEVNHLLEKIKKLDSVKVKKVFSVQPIIHGLKYTQMEIYFLVKDILMSKWDTIEQE